jgi:hypothetical protein
LFVPNSFDAEARASAFGNGSSFQLDNVLVMLLEIKIESYERNVVLSQPLPSHLEGYRRTDSQCLLGEDLP